MTDYNLDDSKYILHFTMLVYYDHAEYENQEEYFNTEKEAVDYANRLRRWMKQVNAVHKTPLAIASEKNVVDYNGYRRFLKSHAEGHGYIKSVNMITKKYVKVEIIKEFGYYD